MAGVMVESTVSAVLMTEREAMQVNESSEGMTPEATRESASSKPEQMQLEENTLVSLTPEEKAMDMDVDEDKDEVPATTSTDEELLNAADFTTPTEQPLEIPITGETPDAMASLPGVAPITMQAYQALALDSLDPDPAPVPEPVKNEVSQDFTQTLEDMLKTVVANREKQGIEALASKYTVLEVMGFLQNGFEQDVEKVLYKAGEVFKGHLREQVAKNSQRKTYQLNNVAWSATELEYDVGLSSEALRKCEEKQPSGKAKLPGRDTPPVTPSKVGDKTPPTEPSPMAKKKPLQTKKKEAGLQLTQYFTVKEKKKEKEPGTPTLAAPALGAFVLKEGTRYTPYDMYAFDKLTQIDGSCKTKAYTLPGEKPSKGRKIPLSVPTLEDLLSRKHPLDLEDVREAINDAYAKGSVNMFHTLVSRGSTPLEVVALKDHGQLQYVGSAPDPTKEMSAVWPVDERMPRDTKEVDYDDFSDGYSENESAASGSSLGDSVEASEDSEGAGSFVEDESEEDMPTARSAQDDCIRIEGPLKHLTFASADSRNFVPLSQIATPVCTLPIGSCLKVPLKDYYYREVMKRHLDGAVKIPEGLSQEGDLFAEGVEQRRAAAQKVVWDESLKMLLELVHCSFHSILYLVDSFREKCPMFSKSAVSNKIKEVAAKDPARANAWMVRPTLLEQLDLTELSEKLPILVAPPLPVARRATGRNSTGGKDEDSPTNGKKKTTGKPASSAKKKKLNHPVFGK